MSGKIYKRSIIEKILPFIKTRDIVILHGARQVGKTSIMFYLLDKLKKEKETTFFIDLEDSRLVRILDGGVDEFIKYLQEEGVDFGKLSSKNKKVFVFIDEIQYLQNPSSFLKLLADHHPEIKIITSGSSSFNIKSKFKDSLVGRTVNFDIYNLSFIEFLQFNEYFFNPNQALTEKKTDELKKKFVEYLLFGGYPKIVLTPSVEMKEKYLQQIIDTYIKKDVRDLADIKDINKFNRLMEILAAQSGQLLNVVELSNTIGIAKQTVESYLFILEQTYIIKLLRPHSSNLRAELTKMPKIFFFDTGLMQMLWMKQLQKDVIGSVFETGIFCELVKKYGIDKVYFWRTADKKEIDFVLKNGKKLLPIEAKYNFAQFDDTAIKYFLDKYKQKDYHIVSIKGEKKIDIAVYPWEL